MLHLLVSFAGDTSAAFSLTNTYDCHIMLLPFHIPHLNFLNYIVKEIDVFEWMYRSRFRVSKLIYVSFKSLV